MKKIISLAVIALILSAGFKASAQFRYGPAVEVGVTNLKFKQDLFDVSKQIGYGAGVAAELMFPGVGFGIDFGLSYEMRGAKLNMAQCELWNWMGVGNRHLQLHTLVLPIHLRFKYTRLNGIEDKIAPLIYAGPSFGFNVGHSANSALEYAGADLGIDMGLGAEVFRRWQVSVSYTLGMTYTLKAKILTNFSARSNSWAVRVAYLF